MLSSFYHAGLAFAEGVAMMVSPCILPVLPFILGGAVTGGTRRAVLVVAGFVTSFTLFSMASRGLIAQSGLRHETIQSAAYFLLAGFGLVMLWPLLEQRFALWATGLSNRAAALAAQPFAGSNGGGFLLGMIVGLIWTPCAGPLLAAALLQVIRAESHAEAFLTITAFSAGAGLPMLAIALWGRELLTRMRGAARYAVPVRRGIGLLLVILGTAGFFGFDPSEWVVSAQASARDAGGGDRLRQGLAAPYAAPSFAGLGPWMNAAPLDLAGLKGKVVLVSFWTYSCINCIRTLPQLNEWHGKYAADGLVIVGIHAPEFSFERDAENVLRALRKFDIRYPVALDNGFQTWKAYNNRYWPSHYLIDREGRVVYTHVGEGAYDVTEGNIRHLLGLRAQAGGSVHPP